MSEEHPTPAAEQLPSKPPSTDETFDSGSRSGRRAAYPQEPLTRGTGIGRYVLLDQLGAGAMGVVYSAYDPELDRKLAIKLLHPRPSTREAKAVRNRLRREAQALARLTHPNVVAVHDVGTHRGRVFVAMEFIAGKTLRQWLRADPLHPPSVDAVIEVFTAAAHGLAAAHRAGLVHRDFKPENVLLGDDGLVRVVDFGLARRSSAEELEDESIDTSGTISMDDYESIASTAARSLELSLTGTGRAMGTPAYMAPEQHLGEVATVRSDQFAFCVALWEALYGERPFPGRDLPSLTLSVTTGDLREPPNDGPYAHRVPSHMHRALVRGLNIEPDARFIKIDDLLEALTHDPQARRRKLGRFLALNVMGAGVVFGAGMFAAGYFNPPVVEDELTQCTPRARLSTVWTQPRQAAILSRFAELDAPFAEYSGREVVRRLDAYATQWTAAWSDTCEVERNVGVTDELELQRECLAHHLSELGVFIDTLVATNAAAFAERAEYAVAAAEGLPSITTCRDPSRLYDAERSATEGELVAALEQRMSQARSLSNLGDPAQGRGLAESAVKDARALTSPRTLTRALLLLADLESAAEEHDLAHTRLLEAYAVADEHGEDWLRAEAALVLTGITGFNLQRAGESKTWEQVSDSLLRRIGDPADLRGRWHQQVGTVRMRQSEFDAARAALNQALSLLEQVHGSEARELESVLQRLGSVARERGDYDRALEFHTRLLARREAAYGPDHPLVASIHGSLGNDAFFRTDYKLAREHYEAALRIVASSYGEDSPAYEVKLSNYAAVLERLGELDEAEKIYRKLVESNISRYGEQDARLVTPLENLGLVMVSAFELEEATALFRRSLALCAQHYGEAHPRTGGSQLNLGFALYLQGEYEEARALYDQALATWRAKLGDDHPDLAIVYGNLADLDFYEGRIDDAKRNFELSYELTSAGIDEDAPDLGYSLTGLAEVALARAQVPEAIEHAERALRLREDTWLPAGDRGRTQLVLSRALHARGRAEDRSWVRDLALLAREDIRRSKNATRLGEATDWLESL